jgi:hypothetical protein
MDYDQESVSTQVMHDDEMWQTFHALGCGFSAHLIHPVNGTCVWLTGEGPNGPANFDVEREVIEELKSLGLVVSAASDVVEDSSETYLLTDDGRQRYEQYRDMPSDQAEGLFLKVIHEMRRRRR